ncbi:MAG: D-alanyl-D-alanine carboxypeptidase/D-alanyl-D-alanine endopeptidase [Solirubrobacterales bacterium]
MREPQAQAGGRPLSAGIWLCVALALAGAALAPALAGASSGPALQTSIAGPLVGHAPDLPAQIDISGSVSANTAALDRKSLRKRLRKLVKRAGSATGVVVTDLGGKSGKQLFAKRPDSRRVLASNQKLFTTATALDRFGADKRLVTRVYRKGAVTNGKLKGGLYLVGNGDPAFSSRNFAGARGLPHTPIAKLAKRIAGAGIERISGPIRADDTIYDRRRGVPDSGWAYSPFIGGRLGGLTYNGAQRTGDPARAAARALRKALRKNGVEVVGDVTSAKAPRKVLGRSPTAKVRSRKLADLVAPTNKFSNNFYAEMLLKRIGAAGGKGTTNRGAKAVERFARKQGARVQAVDGSGLTRTNRATPTHVVRLLAAMRKHSAAAEFDASLSIAGRDGTLAGRMQGTPAAESCRGKTGTLTGVSALSGYCDSGNDVVAFSILMNDTELTKARKLQDQMVAAIARYRR